MKMKKLKEVVSLDGKVLHFQDFLFQNGVDLRCKVDLRWKVDGMLQENIIKTIITSIKNYNIGLKSCNLY